MFTRRPAARRGNILVFSAVLMVVLMAMLAFSIDVGCLLVARVELQRTADAAAIAAAWDLVEDDVNNSSYFVAHTEAARKTATEFAAMNWVLRQAPSLDGDDVQIGYIADPSDPQAKMDTSGLYRPNAVSVRVRRTAVQNGEVPFFFARALGLDRASAEAEATAALLNDFNGFRAPSDGSNLGLLPFALDIDTWKLAGAGVGTDEWKWNEELQQVQAGADGILEMNLYPQGTGSPGNRGTVDIGSNNNSTSDIARQITKGVTATDLEHHGGALEFDDNGQLSLNGDTGISAGIKDELDSIKGQPRIIPIFEQVAGPGNNAQYTIVQFAGVRVMEVKLTGKQSSKRVIIQPAMMMTRGGIPAESSGKTEHIHSPVWLVR